MTFFLSTLHNNKIKHEDQVLSNFFTSVQMSALIEVFHKTSTALTHTIAHWNELAQAYVKPLGIRKEDFKLEANDQPLFIMNTPISN